MARLNRVQPWMASTISSVHMVAPWMSVFIHPDVEALFAKIAHQPVHLLLILARIADEYVLVHCALLSFAYLFDKRLILGIILIIHDEKIEFEVEWQRVVFVSLLSKFHEFVESNFDN